MRNSAEILDSNFLRRVRDEDLPCPANSLTPEEVGLSSDEILDLFESQVMSRHLDFMARKLRARGEGFYTISSAGHEGNAAVAKAFRVNDMAFLHYRSCAFMIQRSKQVSGQSILRDILHSYMASSEDPIAGGRHKVLGSYELHIPPQTSTVGSHLPKAVGTARSIPLATKLGLNVPLKPDGIVLCSFGDGSLNHSTAQGAINTASWLSYQNLGLPLVFLCEDNGLGISVRTPRDWVESSIANRPGMHYLSCDGRDLLDSWRMSVQAVDLARSSQEPVFLHLKTLRLLGHAGSDIETSYRSMHEIEEQEAQDPLLCSASLLLRFGICSAEQCTRIYQEIQDKIDQLTQELLPCPRITQAWQVMSTILPEPSIPKPSLPPSAQLRQKLFGRDFPALTKPQPMGKLLNWALTDVLLEYENVVVFGEDVGLKGGVYHVSSRLQERFGRARVFDSLLDEQSILGFAIGLAHNGFLPIPEIQFLAYLHNAEDQLRSEAATLSFFSQGQFTNPMVLRIPSLAYQKGFGGHFHNENSLAVLRDIPGLTLACPSNGRDAVLLLRSCIQEALKGRVVVFLEPIARYSTRDLLAEGDKVWSFSYPALTEPVPMPGEPNCIGEGKDLAVLTYGNGVYYSLQAKQDLEQRGIGVRVIDLRWIAPLNPEAITKAVKPCREILIVDECRNSGSLSEALVTLLIEQGIQLSAHSRITAKDSFIPLGEAANLVLPSREEIVEKSLRLVALSKKNVD